MVCNALEIHSKLQIISNRNLGRVGSRTLMSPTSAGERLVNSLDEQFNHTIRLGSIIDHPKRVKENRDGGVSRREFDDTGNRSFLQPAKRAEDFVQRFIRRIFEPIAQTHDDSGISKSCNLHARKDRQARGEP